MKITTQPIHLRSKYRGCLVGLAVGDAMGMRAEGYSREQIRSRFGYIKELMSKNTKTGYKPAGSVTDDTFLCMLTAKSIIAQSSINIEHLTHTYIDALHYDELGITGTTRKALELRSYGRDPEIEIKGPRHSGCGAAVRMPAIALFSYKSEKELIENAIRVSKITHHDNDAVASAVAVALSISWALKNQMHLSILIPSLQNTMVKLKSNLMYNFELAHELVDQKKTTLDGIEEIGVDGASVRVIPSAFYAFIKHSDDYEEMIKTCVNAGGDTGSRAAIAGSISGSYNGIESVPQRWAKKVEGLDVLIDYADKLYFLSSGLE